MATLLAGRCLPKKQTPAHSDGMSTTLVWNPSNACSHPSVRRAHYMPEVDQFKALLSMESSFFRGPFGLTAEACPTERQRSSAWRCTRVRV